MKTKIISLVLTLAILLTCFTTLIAAEGAGTPGFIVVGDTSGQTYANLGAAIDAANSLAGTNVTIKMTGNTTSAAQREAKTTIKNITIDGQGYKLTNRAKNGANDSSIAKLGGTGSFTFTDITFDTTTGKHYFETDKTAVTLKFGADVVFQNTGSTATNMPAILIEKLAHIVIDGAVFKLNYPALAGWATADFAKVEVLSGTLSSGTHSSRTGAITTGYNDTCCMDIFVDVDKVNVYVNNTTTRALTADDFSQVVNAAKTYSTVAVQGAAAKVEAFGYPYQSTNQDSTVTAYAELDAIYAFAPNNAVVNVVKSVDLTSTNIYMSKFDTAKAITLQGKTGSEVITLCAGLAFVEIYSNASLTVENLTIKYDESAATTAAYMFKLHGGKLTLGEGVVAKHADLTGVATGNGATNLIKVTADGAQIVIDGATLTSAGTVIVTEQMSSTTEIKSGTINAKFRVFVANDILTAGSEKDTTVSLTISGGTINHTHASAYAINFFSTQVKNFVMTGGTINTSSTADVIFQGVTKNLQGGKLIVDGTVVYDAPAVTAVGSSLYKNPSYPTDTTKGGIRFTSNLDLNSLDAALIADKVTFGTVIALKADYDALVDKTDLLGDLTKKINVVNTAGTADNGNFSATLLQLSGNALSEELVGVPYVTIVVDGVGTYTYYGNAIVDAAANYDFFGQGA